MVKKQKSRNIISTCEEIIKTFNPNTHSIDTHLLEAVGDTNQPDAKPDEILIQQIVYGCFKEKPLLQVFIDDFYRDNASRVLRKDITMYKVIAYVALFRIEEMGVQKFRELAMSQEPSKMSNFINYVFNEENLWNTLRSSFMTVKDLDYIEKQMLPRIGKYISPMMKLSGDLVQSALDNEAAEAAKEEAKAKGEVGLAKVSRRPPTVPVSPRLTVTRPPVLPEPERIVSEVKAKDVPGFLNNTNMEKINKENKERKEMVKTSVQKKYDQKLQFKFHETKGLRPIEEVKAEIEAEREKELQFNNSYYHPPPDSSSPQEIKYTAAAILREDALYRKKQAEDAMTLKRYEEELRDPTEYYRWQTEMRERDEIEKLKYVAMRREQAKQSAEEAKLALEKQKRDNAIVANLVRQQVEVIKQQTQLEKEIEVLKKQNQVQSISEVRDSRPIEAMQKVLQEKEEKAKRIREELERLRKEKEEQEQIEEEIQADKIRQLRALNTVHRKHVKVFDPTETSGVVLLDSMSYMEMKERQQVAEKKHKEAEEYKRQEIFSAKEKKAIDLQRRSESIQRARALRADANRQTRQAELERRAREEAEKVAAAKAAQALWEEELAKRKAAAEAERAALLAEQERIKRQQQYLGAAQGQVAIMRERQIQMARDRQLKNMEKEQVVLQHLAVETSQKEKLNKTVIHRQEVKVRNEVDEERERSLRFEKLALTEKLRNDVLYKKDMFQQGQRQHEVTKQVLHETNPYATKIMGIVHTEALTASKRMHKI